MTNDVDDGYMGSGKLIKKAISKYGIDNFEKIVLYYCDSEDEMLEKESEIVDEGVVNSDDYYNISLGGGSNFSHIDNRNKVIVYDSDKKISINKNDERWKNGELKAWNKGYFIAKDINDVIYHIKNDDKRWISGELTGFNKNKYLVKDKSGVCFLVDKEDKRLKTGELKLFWKGKKHTEETKKKIGEKNSIIQKGKGNSQFGSCWIYNEELKENKKIKKEDLNNWLNLGWERGRKLTW